MTFVRAGNATWHARQRFFFFGTILDCGISGVFASLCNGLSLALRRNTEYFSVVGEQEPCVDGQIIDDGRLCLFALTLGLFVAWEY